MKEGMFPKWNDSLNQLLPGVELKCGPNRKRKAEWPGIGIDRYTGRAEQ
jgi:hypothetical protein